MNQSEPRSDTKPTPPVRPKLAEAVVLQLTRDIVAGAYPPGTVLPPEPVLQEMFAVSRTVVRDAIGSLVAKNLVQPRRGIGTIVLPRSGWNFLDPQILEVAFELDDDGVYLDSMIAVRAALEAMMAGQAAERRTPEELASLQTQLADMAMLLDDADRFNRADVELHRLIMQASGDVLGPVIVGDLQGRAQPVRRYHGVSDRAHREVSHDEHRAIITAIVAGDSQRASTLMGDHIHDSWRRRRAVGG